ncbi:MAG: tetratricopeptide repeat protein, partial [candidate division Zixibacteria bacterium]|nr:tetratricopeptide repeat protein [candidate division Zixibacteria bacterium]
LLIVLITACVFFTSTDLSSQTLKEGIVTALESGDTTKAIELLDAEIEIDDGYYYYYYILGQIYFNKDNFEKAKENFALAVDKKSKHLESRYYLGLSNYNLGDIDEAEKIFQKGLKKAKKDTKHMFQNGIGLILMKKGEFRDADRAFREALISEDELSNSVKAEYHINLGDANFYQGIPSLAISEYKKALAVDTASKEVYYHWAEACLEMKDYSCALEKLRVVLNKDSTHAQAWNRAGGIYFKAAMSSRSRDERKNRFRETIGSYKRFIELSNIQPDSQHVRVYFELAMSYVNIYGFEDATDYFDKVISIPYEARDIYFYYGKSLWGSRQYEKASEMLLKHIEWVSEQDENYRNSIRDEELYRMLGDTYYYRKENKNFSKATHYYSKSLDADPDQKRLLQSMAFAYHNLRSYKQAITYYQKRIEIGIDSTSVAILKNASSCALSIANSDSEGDILELDDDIMEEVVDDVNYYELAIDYMQQYLTFYPNDNKMILLIADTYLRTMGDCTNGIEWYKKLLELEPDNCDAKTAIGFSYFGGVCEKNFPRALKYLKEAYACKESKCDNVELVLWIAQCYHLYAADKVSAKQDANEEFKNAFNWYGKVLKCDSSHEEAKKGQDNTRFEFYDDKG